MNKKILKCLSDDDLLKIETFWSCNVLIVKLELYFAHLCNQYSADVLLKAKKAKYVFRSYVNNEQNNGSVFRI